MRFVVARLILPVLLLLPTVGCKRAKRLAAQATGSVGVTDPTFTSDLQAALSTGKMDTLHWPDISDVQQPANAFYDSRDYLLAWSKNGKPTSQATGMMEAFSNARLRGLDPEDYDASRWQGRVAALNTDQGKVAFDTTMTVNAMRFLNAIHMGRADPKYFAFGIDSSVKQLDLPTVLEQQFVSASSVDPALTTLEPTSPQYKALKDELKHYLDLVPEDHGSPLPDVPKGAIALSAGYPALQPLAQRLELVGDLPASTDTSQQPDLGELTDALKHFQQRHGLQVDGKLNQATVDALNTPMTTRVSQISDTMERWRWLPDQYQEPAILVNLPEFVVRTFDGANEVFSMRVVDGQSSEDEHHTPMLVNQMKYLVFRPYWNLPVSIAKKDLVPHMEKNPGYLAEHGYETVNNKGEEVPGSAEAIEHGTVLVRQKPGPKNSLGLVKFMFPNQFNVYLHDTDAHALFDRVRRDYSHGCVRLQDPAKMADWVLSGDSKWDPETIQQTMDDESIINKTVLLPKPLPIVLFYGTAYVDSGAIGFYKDMYGYDADLEKVLKAGPPYPHKPIKAAAEASV